MTDEERLLTNFSNQVTISVSNQDTESKITVKDVIAKTIKKDDKHGGFYQL